MALDQMRNLLAEADHAEVRAANDVMLGALLLKIGRLLAAEGEDACCGSSNFFD